MKKKILALFLMVTMILSSGANVFADTNSSSEEDAPFFTGVLNIGGASGIAMTKSGDIVVSDVYYKILWSINEKGILPFVGTMNTDDIYGQTFGGYNDSVAEKALFASPWGIVPYLSGFAVSDTENNVIRYATKSSVKTFVGSGEAGFKNEFGIKAVFNGPTGLASDEKGNLYIADTGNNVIRKMDKSGTVTTFAGTKEGCTDGDVKKAAFREPTGLYYKDDVLYVCDSGNHRICKIENGKVTTISGGFAKANSVEFYSGDYVNGNVSAAKFSNPQGITVDDEGTIYVADTGNSAVRKIKSGIVSTVISANPLGGDIYPISPRGLYISGETLYVCDAFAKSIFTVSLKAEKLPFTDIVTGSRYREAVVFVYSNGLLSGVSETKFEPFSDVTRADFIMALASLFQKIRPNEIIQGTSEFEDVPKDSKYYNAVAWAVDNGYASGVDSKHFAPSEPVTHEQAISMLYRLAKESNFSSEWEKGGILEYPDYAYVSSWAKDAMDWAVGNNINITDNLGNLDAKDPITRGEAAKILLYFWDAFIK
ncbi:MAG: S-layer homology domain-containing protein [Lachnospiraceae bacterium]|nr:S-layer homology domain-containing protein [Lachnospiraceae bacterium]